MRTFPTLSAGNVAKYPVTRSNRRRARVHVNSDLSEQRYSKGTALAEFNLIFNKITSADKQALRTFWDGSEGALDTTWQFPFEGVTYSDCQFTGTFTPVMVGPGLWNLHLQFRSRTPGSFLTATPGTSTFPTITSGVIAQYPHSAEDRFFVLSETLDSGMSSTWSQNPGGLPLMRWRLTYSAITATEAHTLEAFWERVHGQLGQFGFTDVDGTVYPRVRFDQDKLDIRYIGPSQWATEIQLAELV